MSLIGFLTNASLIGDAGVISHQICSKGKEISAPEHLRHCVQSKNVIELLSSVTVGGICFRFDIQHLTVIKNLFGEKGVCP